ncbi:hypothetical protein CAPN004_23610 [Capnocytophaga cynodegmi]|uniref:hypothetical protein n=1 Tax=Capnocytophaga cynodegmi TaxID=28189 RepID=UPI001AD45305|nr:hypothetical protein [Capnocytophaga cynodegmi]GIM53332.1 hypothetical protein CAPN004_23610 [Capnocytophaga cynodegmi]
MLIASEELRKISEDIRKLAQKKREETEVIFGKQGEEFEKELQEWAIAEEKRQIEIAQIQKQDGIADNSVAASVDVTTEPAENKTETQKTSEEKAENKKDTKSDEPYYIEHNDKKYYDGDILKMPYIRRKYERFVMGNLSDSTTINWTLYQRGADKKILESYSKTKNKRNTKTFDFTKKESDIATLLSVEAQAETEGNPKVEIFIEKEVKKFKYNELKAIDNENKNRVAKSGETLYYVHQTGKKYDFRSPTFQIDISPKVIENEIPTNHIEWIYNGTNIDHDKLSLSRTIHYNDDNKGKIEVQARTGNPMAEKYKKVNVEWVKEDRSKFSFNLGTPNVPDKMKKIFELTQAMEKIAQKIDKIPFLKRTQKNERPNNALGFHFYAIPCEIESFNEEDKESRYYYRRKIYVGGFEVGIAGNVKQTIWEIPLYKLPLGKKVKEKLKEYIKLEVFVEASTNLQGEIKGEIKYKKYPNEKEFKEQSSTFISEMTMPVEFGAGADAKLLKKNDYLHFNATASGKVNTKLLYIRWRNDEGFDIGFLREDVNLDFKVDVSGSFLGFKLETAPFYQRILLMKKQQQNGKQ